jgi:hypothetical protein
MRRASLIACLLLAACGKESASTTRKPAGTIADPVKVCERVADVCVLDRAKLGVCTTRKSGRDLYCASQH